MQYATLTDKAAKDFSMIPGLAESWEGSDDGKTYTYKLRDGPEVVRRQAADRRGHRLTRSTARARRSGSTTRRRPRTSPRRRRTRTVEITSVGARPEAARRWTSTSSRSTSRSKYDAKERDEVRRRRTASARARSRSRSSRRASSRDSRPTPTTGAASRPSTRSCSAKFNNADAMVAALKTGEIDCGSGHPGRRVPRAQEGPEHRRPSRATRAASPSSRSTAATASAKRPPGAARTPRSARRSRTRSTRRRSSTACSRGLGKPRRDHRARPPNPSGCPSLSERAVYDFDLDKAKHDPRRRRLQGHRRRRRARDARRRAAAQVPLRGALRRRDRARRSRSSSRAG